MNIAILGGYGDVGCVACRYLLSLDLSGLNDVRIGGRRALAHQHAQQDARLSYHNVDFQDQASVETFIKGCKLLLNCAGPSHLIGDKVAKVAANEGVIYVDVAGDEPLYAELDLQQYQQQGLTAVLSAGLQPGLTGLFPRWLAEQAFETVDSLESYFGVRDRFTPVAGDDYLQAATEQAAQAGAVWQQGDIVSGALNRQTDVILPFFTEPVTTLPLLNAENIRLAQRLQLGYGAWQNAIAGQHILTAFNQVHSMSRDDAITALCRASELDLAGRQPYALMLLQMCGTLINGQTGQRRIGVLQSARGGGNAELSGAIAAITVKAALNNQIPTGVHYCAQVLSPSAALNELQQLNALSVLTILDTSIEDMVSLEQEEGAI